MAKAVGKVRQVMGAVVESSSTARFPAILNSLETTNNGSRLVLEVAQHLGENACVRSQWTRPKVSFAVRNASIRVRPSWCPSATKRSAAS